MLWVIIRKTSLLMSTNNKCFCAEKKVLFVCVEVLRLSQPIQVMYSAVSYIMKTCLYNFNPLKPHLYIIKLEFTGVYIIFLISVQNRLWVLIRTASLKNIRVF